MYNKFIVPEVDKYKQNKTGITDTDYEHVSRNYLQNL